MYFCKNMKPVIILTEGQYTLFEFDHNLCHLRQISGIVKDFCWHEQFENMYISKTDRQTDCTMYHYIILKDSKNLTA